MKKIKIKSDVILTVTCGGGIVDEDEIVFLVEQRLNALFDLSFVDPHLTVGVRFHFKERTT